MSEEREHGGIKFVFSKPTGVCPRNYIDCPGRTVAEENACGCTAKRCAAVREFSNPESGEHDE